MKKILVIAIKLLVTIGIFWLLTYRIEWRKVTDILLGAISLKMVVYAVVLITFQNLLAIFRWWVIAHSLNANIKFRDASQLLMAGLFLNQVLPSTLGGDGLRLWYMHRRGIEVNRAFSSIIADRVITLIGLLALIVLTQPFIKFVAIVPRSTGIFFIVLLLLLIGLWLGLRLGERICTLPGLRFLSRTAGIFQTLRHYFFSFRQLITPVVTAIFGFMVMAFIVYVLAMGLDIPITFWQCQLLCPPIFLLATLPISISGWGVREGAMVVMFHYLGVTAEQALAVSIALGLTVLVGSLPGCLFLFGGNPASSRKPGEVAA